MSAASPEGSEDKKHTTALSAFEVVAPPHLVPASPLGMHTPHPTARIDIH